jgi:hypothetical protein
VPPISKTEGVRRNFSPGYNEQSISTRSITQGVHYLINGEMLIK